MKNEKKLKKVRLPLSFRPLLWGLDWNMLDAEHDREDIVVNTLNEGTVDQWRWIRAAYGDVIIRSILKRRMASEFHPESIQLARIVFGIKDLRNARRSPHKKRN